MPHPIQKVYLNYENKDNTSGSCSVSPYHICRSQAPVTWHDIDMIWLDTNIVHVQHIQYVYPIVSALPSIPNREFNVMFNNQMSP